MKLGVRLIDDLGTPQQLLSLATLADQLGFNSVWYPHDPFRTNSWVLAAATALVTQRIQIHVRANPYTTDPSEIATYLATLDHLSGGRANLSIGLHTTEMLSWIGLDGSDVRDRITEAYHLVRALFSENVGEFSGKCYRWTRHAYFRFPVLRSEPPIYICPFGSDLLELSGEIGDGSIPMVAPPEAAPRVVEKILAGATRSGRKRTDLRIVAFVWLSVDDDRQAARNALRPVVAYFGHYLDAEDLALVGLGVHDFDAVHEAVIAGRRDVAEGLVTEEMLALGIAGNPQECLEKLEMLADVGVDEVSMGGPLGPDPHKALHTIATKIAPQLK